MTENREYKSDVFSMLMEDKRNALDVYNALNGSSYDDPDIVEFVNLEPGISLSVRNDAAFIVDTDISINEHQSKYNPNMPLRSLIYYSTIMQKMVKNRDMLGTRIIKIPTPHFAIFYNGTSDRPVRETMKLSDSFERFTDRPELELICTVYNINPDKDKELLDNCRILGEYTEFVETIRRYESGGVEGPIEKAIEHCIENHILEDFLKERGTEVLKAMAIDMTFERREVLIRQEVLKEGCERGADMLAKLLKLFEPGSDEFNKALNATEEERQELYKKYNISADNEPF